MADEQDVFISGISGSIAQWGTEATASKMESTLKQISAQNTAMIQLMTAVKNGESVTQKQLQSAVNATKQGTKATQSASKKDSSQNATSQGLMKSTIQSIKDGWSNSSSGIIDQLRKNQLEESKNAKALKVLMGSGMSREDAAQTIKNEQRDKKTAGMMKAMAGSIIAFSVAADEAAKVGFSQRFDMATELRQSGLMNGLGAVNEGMISIAKTVTETGFTFGQAAEFTKQFSEAVGVVGVKSTLEFVNSMATGPAGLMTQFAMEFGDVAHLSGEYLDSLRISGQLHGRDQQQLRAGMDSFMSNVQATSNVLKISMQEAASLLKNSLDTEQRGMLLTLPKEIQSSLKSGMEMMGGMNNPLGDLIATRLGAGKNQFMQTSQFAEMSGSRAGQEMIAFANQAASILENGGDEAFQQFLGGQGTNFIDNLIASTSSAANRGVAMTDGTMALIAELAKMRQTLPEIGQKISGGGRADQAELKLRDVGRTGQVAAEAAVNALMPGYIANIEKLTETNRNFAEQASKTIISHANVIDGLINSAGVVERSITGLGTIFLGLGQAAGMGVDFVGNLAPIVGTNIMSNDERDARSFTAPGTGDGRTINNNQSADFSKYANDMIKQINSDKNATIEQKQAELETLKNTLTSLMGTGYADGANGKTMLESQIKLLGKLEILIGTLSQ